MRFLARQSAGSASRAGAAPARKRVARYPTHSTPQAGATLHARFDAGRRSRSGAGTAGVARGPGVALREAAPRTLRPVPTSGAPDRARGPRPCAVRALSGARVIRWTREVLVERFLPLARQLARRYQRPEEPFDDLFQVACLGLVNAIDRFDPSRGCGVLELRRADDPGGDQALFPRPDVVGTGAAGSSGAGAAGGARANRAIDRPAAPADGRRAGRRARARRGARARGARGLGRLPGDVAVAAAQQRRRGGRHARRRGRHAEDGFGARRGPRDARRTAAALTPRAREVVRLRFEEDLTQAEIGELIGVSQMQVSRILRQSLGRLRTVAEAGSSSGAR